MSVPTIADVERITGHADPVVRNLQITYCYHELATAIGSLSGSGANWCTFATWASKQAGQSIRQEDLLRAFERLFRRSPEVLTLLHGAAREAARLDVRWPAPALAQAALRALDAARSFRRAADAVARGNRKVFEGIAREFARFMADFQHDTTFDPVRTEEFCAALLEGDPPEGQRLLREAFTAYCQARFEADARARAEMMFLANLLVGYHEQIRLQPDILEAMNAGLGDTEALKRKLLRLLLPGFWLRIRFHLAHLLARIDPADGGASTGTRDWSDFAARIRFIAHLFRAYHERQDLLDPPFTPEQVAALKAGRRGASDRALARTTPLPGARRLGRVYCRTETE